MFTLFTQCNAAMLSEHSLHPLLVDLTNSRTILSPTYVFSFGAENVFPGSLIYSIDPLRTFCPLFVYSLFFPLGDSLGIGS